MGSDFVRIDINEHLGDEPRVHGGRFCGHEGDVYKFDCPGLDTLLTAAEKPAASSGQ